MSPARFHCATTLTYTACCNICSESQRILVRCTDVRQQSRFDSREKQIRVDEKEKSFKKDLRKRDLEKGITKVEKKNKRWRRRTRSGEEEQEVEKRNKKWRRTIR